MPFVMSMGHLWHTMPITYNQGILLYKGQMLKKGNQPQFYATLYLPITISNIDSHYLSLTFLYPPFLLPLLPLLPLPPRL
jgi:hypothetical protein